LWLLFSGFGNRINYITNHSDFWAMPITNCNWQCNRLNSSLITQITEITCLCSDRSDSVWSRSCPPGWGCQWSLSLWTGGCRSRCAWRGGLSPSAGRSPFSTPPPVGSWPAVSSCRSRRQTWSFCCGRWAAAAAVVVVGSMRCNT
jgi:hypothetical protein